MRPFRKTRESAKIAARRKEALNLVALEQKHTVFSEYWLSQREGYGFEVARVREFDLADEPEEVDPESLVTGDWDLVIRQALEGVAFMVFADMSSSLTYYPEHFEYSKGFIRDIAVSLLIHAVQQKMSPVGLITFSDKVERVFPPQSGAYARYILDQFLSEQPRAEDARTSLACLTPYVREFQDAMICIVSDFEDRSIRGSWLTGPEMSQLDLVPIIVRDPVEKIGIPKGTQFWYRNPEGGEARSFTAGEKELALIQKESEQYYSQVCQMFQNFGVTPVMLDTANAYDCHKKLSRYFAERLVKYR